MQRRTLFKALGGGVVVLAGGAGALFLRGTKMWPLPGEKLKYFSPREYSIFMAVADALLELPAKTADGIKVPSIEEASVGLKADEYMSRNIPDAQHDVHVLLSLFDNALAGFLFCGTIAPFSQMHLASRRAYLSKWENHSIPVLRSGFIALKKLAISVYYASPETWESIHYPGPMEIP